MPSSRFVSYAQNGEDVVLWRALGDIDDGVYVEVGANHPVQDSASYAFYQRGWAGITVEPVSEFAALQRATRPRDTQVEAAISATPGEITLHVIPGTGLSTVVDEITQAHDGAGYQHEDRVVPSRRLDDVLDEHLRPGSPIHFLLIDVEGAEGQVLQSIDLRTWRPWVLVVESTEPNSTRQSHEAWDHLVLAAGYRFCLFDGLSRFYVADEHADRAARLSYPACVLDGYVTATFEEIDRERERLLAEAVHWRSLALSGWATALSGLDEPSGDPGEVQHLRQELAAMRATLSWRITAPLRRVRTLSRRTGE